LRAENHRLIFSWYTGPVIELALSNASGIAAAAGDAGPNGNVGGEQVTQIIPLVRLRQHFGGYRTCFVCPGSNTHERVSSDAAGDAGPNDRDGNNPDAGGCGRRVLKLYLSGRYFLCRHCCGLVYSVRHEQPWQQAFRRTAKLRRRRLAITGIDASFPEKPKDMPVDVYERLLDEVLQAERQAIEARTEWFQRLVARAGKPRAGRHKPGPQFTL
jgi:hypothetical protein